MEAIFFQKDMIKKPAHQVVSSPPFTTKGDLSSASMLKYISRVWILTLILDSRKSCFMGKCETEMKSKGNYSSVPDSCMVTGFSLNFFRKPPFISVFRVAKIFRVGGQNCLHTRLSSHSESTPITGDKLWIYIFIEDQLSKVIVPFSS